MQHRPGTPNHHGSFHSIPLCNVFADTYPNAEIILIEVEEPLTLMHVPNEMVRPDYPQQSRLTGAGGAGTIRLLRQAGLFERRPPSDRAHRTVTRPPQVPPWPNSQPGRAPAGLVIPQLGEREVVAAMLDQERHRLRPGLVMVADKGLAGRDFEQLVATHGGSSYAPTVPMRRAGTARWGGCASGSRAPSTPSKTSSAWSATAAAPCPRRGPVAQRLLTLAAAIWWNWEIGAPDKRSLVAYDH